MDAGGELRRKELFAKVNTRVFSSAFESMSLQPAESGYNAEDAKVAKYGDLG